MRGSASLGIFRSKAWAGCGFDVGRLDVVIVLAPDLHGQRGAAPAMAGEDGRARWVGAVSVTPLEHPSTAGARSFPWV